MFLLCFLWIRWCLLMLISCPLCLSSASMCLSMLWRKTQCCQNLLYEKLIRGKIQNTSNCLFCFYSNGRDLSGNYTSRQCLDNTRWHLSIWVKLQMSNCFDSGCHLSRNQLENTKYLDTLQSMNWKGSLLIVMEHSRQPENNNKQETKCWIDYSSKSLQLLYLFLSSVLFCSSQWRMGCRPSSHPATSKKIR